MKETQIGSETSRDEDWEENKKQKYRKNIFIDDCALSDNESDNEESESENDDMEEENLARELIDSTYEEDEKTLREKQTFIAQQFLRDEDELFRKYKKRFASTSNNDEADSKINFLRLRKNEEQSEQSTASDFFNIGHTSLNRFKKSNNGKVKKSGLGFALGDFNSFDSKSNKAKGTEVETSDTDSEDSVTSDFKTSDSESEKSPDFKTSAFERKKRALISIMKREGKFASQGQEALAMSQDFVLNIRRVNRMNPTRNPDGEKKKNEDSTTEKENVPPKRVITKQCTEDKTDFSFMWSSQGITTGLARQVQPRGSLLSNLTNRQETLQKRKQNQNDFFSLSRSKDTSSRFVKKKIAKEHHFHVFLTSSRSLAEKERKNMKSKDIKEPINFKRFYKI